MGNIRFGNIQIDCKDEQGLCEFYHKLLGWNKSIMFGRPALQSENGILFLFEEIEDYVAPVWPEEKNMQQKQLHFDFKVSDVDAAVKYAESIGATKSSYQCMDGDYITMFDPDGHVFCLCAEDMYPDSSK